MISEKLRSRFYSEPKYNGTMLFYNWVRSNLSASDSVLNIGAGPPTRNPIRMLRGEAKEVIGADIDPIVLQNDELDSAVLIQNGQVPLPDGVFDMALSDNVLEHVDDPITFLREVNRLLKPGGKFIFRTPNLFHYVAMISALTPQSFHRAVANRVRGMPTDAHEPWPTHYRMNTVRKLRSLARETGFSEVEIQMVEPNPSYLQFHAAPFLVGVVYERLVNSSPIFSGLRANIFGLMRK